MIDRGTSTVNHNLRAIPPVLSQFCVMLSLSDMDCLFDLLMAIHVFLATDELVPIVHGENHVTLPSKFTLNIPSRLGPDDFAFKAWRDEEELVAVAIDEDVVKS